MKRMRLVGVLIFGIVALARRQHFHDLAHQHVQAVALARAHRESLRQTCNCFISDSISGKQLVFSRPDRSLSAPEKRGNRACESARREIRLRSPRRGALLRFLRTGCPRFAGPRPAGNRRSWGSSRNLGGFKLTPRRIHQHQHQVARFQRFVHLLQHAPVELRCGLVHSGRIHKDDLRRRMHALARGTSTTPAMRLRVVCGLAVTMATFSPVRALSKVLLPTLGRPRMATNPDFKAVVSPFLHYRGFARHGAEFRLLSSPKHECEKEGCQETARQSG